MRKKRAKKEIGRAENQLRDARDKLKRAESRQDKAEAKAKARNTDLKEAQADKLEAAVDAEQKRVDKAEKELARVRAKHAKIVGDTAEPAPARTLDVQGMDAAAAGGAIQAALADSMTVVVTGDIRLRKEPLELTLGRGMTVLWQAALQASCPQAAILIRSAPDAADSGELPLPVFCIAEGGQIVNDCEGGSILAAGGAAIKVDGGSVHSLHGDGIATDGTAEILRGVVAANGAAGRPGVAVRAGDVKIQGGLVFGRAPEKSQAGGGVLSKAAVVGPHAKDLLAEGEGCVCVWVTSDGVMPEENGSEVGLVYWPEDACVWWDVAPDGATSIYAGRLNQSSSVPIGTQKLPTPPDMQAAGNAVVTLPIVFEAKTEDAERPVLLDIEWGWDLLLSKPGAMCYDNRLAIVCCALSNSAYHEDSITALFRRLGFADPVLHNYGTINDTSACAFAQAQIREGSTAKTVFAVVNRGSKTLMDWKGNILDETIRNMQFFGQSADAVAAALRKYVDRYAQSDSGNNIFLVTGHSLGAIVTELMAAQHFQAYPARNVFAYAFAAPLADPEAKTDDSRPIYNILNEKDVVTTIPPRPGYKRIGTHNYTFSTTGKNARVMARPFRFLSHMDIDAISRVSSFSGFFKQAIPSIMWNHSLTTYMAYLLAGGPDSVRGSGGLWSVVQKMISAAGGSDSQDQERQ